MNDINECYDKAYTDLSKTNDYFSNEAHAYKIHQLYIMKLYFVFYYLKPNIHYRRSK